MGQPTRTGTTTPRCLNTCSDSTPSLPRSSLDTAAPLEKEKAMAAKNTKRLEKKERRKPSRAIPEAIMIDLSQLLIAHPFPTALARIRQSFACQPDCQTCGAAAIRH